MSSQNRWKLLGALVIASVVLGGVVGWQQFAPKLTPRTTITVTPTATTVAGTQTTVAPQRQTEWIRVQEVRQIDYYVSLLQSNGTAPYVHLAIELCKLPDLNNATAVAKITYLALNATNREVKEAFTLMINGGTPDQRDYPCKVPSWNTELQVLYWLACQNEFKRDDTLALAIAMVNGLWTTLGDEQVTTAVHRDTSNLLNFFRETNEMQESMCCHQLERYPLEAKICLAWTGGQSVGVAKQYAASLFLLRKFSLRAYEWCITSLDTLTRMREIIANKKWWTNDTARTVERVMDYFWYDKGHWIYTPSPGRMVRTLVVVDGVQMSNWMYGSTNHIFRQYLEKDKVYGVSYDFLPFIDSWLKSVGIASNDMWIMYPERPRVRSFYDFNVYYLPELQVWTTYSRQIDDWLKKRGADESVELKLFRPPIALSDYLSGIQGQRQNDETLIDKGVNFSTSLYVDNKAYASILGEIAFVKARDMFMKGIPTSQMKQWLLYS